MSRELVYDAVWGAYYKMAERRRKPGLTFAEVCKLVDIALDTKDFTNDYHYDDEIKIGGTA